jgi:hypothetical protein
MKRPGCGLTAWIEEAWIAEASASEEVLRS